MNDTIFQDLEEAKEYAKKNFGCTFVKNNKGPGYILKGSNVEYKNYKQRQDDTKCVENIKHGRPTRSGLSWRDHEIAKLIKLRSSGQSIDHISIELERSVLAVSSKLYNLDLIAEEEHQKILSAHLSD